MIKHKDEIPVFIPKGKVNFIILGTMGSINARSINGQKPEGEFFYYNNSRNHFWKVIQLLINPKKEAAKSWSVKETLFAGLAASMMVFFLLDFATHWVGSL